MNNDDTFHTETPNPDVFTPRKDINQFLRDGELINALYDRILDILFNTSVETSFTASKKVLAIFNYAYKICWLITERKATSYEDVHRMMRINHRGRFSPDLAYYAAWSILKVYGNKYDFDKEILNDILRDRRHTELLKNYEEVVESQEEPQSKICFSTPDMQVFIAHSASISTSENNDQNKGNDAKSVESTLDQSFTNIRTICLGLKQENDRLAKETLAIKKDYSSIIVSKDATITKLRAEVSQLRQQLADKETNGEVKNVAGAETNRLHEVLNWGSIANYALGLYDYKDVQVITNMLNRLSSRNHYFDKELDKSIDTLDEHVRKLHQPVFNQINNIQGDYVENQTNTNTKTIDL